MSKVTVTCTVQPVFGGQQAIIGGCVDEIERIAPSFLPLADAIASAFVRALPIAALVALARSAAEGWTVP